MFNTPNINFFNYKSWDTIHIISWKNTCNADVTFNYELASEISKMGNICINVTMGRIRVTTAV